MYPASYHGQSVRTSYLRCFTLPLSFALLDHLLSSIRPSCYLLPPTSTPVFLKSSQQCFLIQRHPATKNTPNHHQKRQAKLPKSNLRIGYASIRDFTTRHASSHVLCRGAFSDSRTQDADEQCKAIGPCFSLVHETYLSVTAYHHGTRASHGPSPGTAARWGREIGEGLYTWLDAEWFACRWWCSISLFI